MREIVWVELTDGGEYERGKGGITGIIYNEKNTYMNQSWIEIYKDGERWFAIPTKRITAIYWED